MQYRCELNPKSCTDLSPGGYKTGIERGTVKDEQLQYRQAEGVIREDICPSKGLRWTTDLL